MRSRPDLVPLACTNCGAALAAPPPEATSAHCPFCGHTYEIVRAEEPRPPPPPPPPPPPRAARAGGSTLGGLFTFVVVGAIGAFVWFKVQHKPIPELPQLGDVASRLGDALAPPLRWDDVGGAPIPARLGPRRDEGIVARFREGGTDQLRVAAVDAATAKLRWSVGPFGTYGEAYQYTHFAVSGDHVVVTDVGQKIHLYDLGTGKETATFTMTDRARQACGAPSGGEVFVDVADGKTLLVDVPRATTIPTVRPPWCPRGVPDTTLAPSGVTKGAPTVAGFRALEVWMGGGDGIALGVRAPGTEIPMLVGFATDTHAVRWQKPVPAVDLAKAAASTMHGAVAQEHYVVPYELAGGGYRLTALDVRSGERAWDVELPKRAGVDRPDALRTSTSYVYVGRASEIEVFDAKSGKLVGTFGGH